MAVEMGTLLDRERHVMDVGFDVTRRLQSNRNPTNVSGNGAAHDDPLGRDRPRDPALLADDHLGAPNVALNFSIDLQCALADDFEALADDLQIIANHGLRKRFR